MWNFLFEDSGFAKKISLSSFFNLSVCFRFPTGFLCRCFFSRCFHEESFFCLWFFRGFRFFAFNRRMRCGTRRGRRHAGSCIGDNISSDSRDNPRQLRLVRNVERRQGSVVCFCEGREHGDEGDCGFPFRHCEFRQDVAD